MSSAFPSERAAAAVVHGSCVAWSGRGLLILGPSGSGKSGLALQLMAHGAGLVADDRTRLTRPDDGPPVAAPMPAIAGLIEARGVGILAAEAAQPCRLALLVDLGKVETARLPEPRERAVLGWRLPMLHKVDSPHFAAAVLQYIKAERR